MGIGERKTVNKKGRVRRARTITVHVDTGERYEPTEQYPKGRKNYKQVVKVVGLSYSVSKAEAQSLYKKEQSKYKRNRYTPSPSLSDFGALFIEFKRDVEGKKSWERDQYALNNLIGFYGGDKRLSEISPEDIDEYKKDRVRSVKKKTINNELTFLRSVYNLAIKRGEVTGTNPVSQAGLIPKKEWERPKLRQGPTSEEEELLIQELPPSAAWIFRFALSTGMRISEVINLTVDQIGEVVYQDSIVKVVTLHPSDTKTGGERTIPLNKDAEQVLNEALEYNAGRHNRVFLIKSRPYKEGGKETEAQTWPFI